ncbi:MAG: methyltransferase domain-containing protein [candidate division NC10 bacterium]|nr:methyltransferase domain-containing protein [candidate division NC10 bacterium]
MVRPALLSSLPRETEATERMDAPDLPAAQLAGALRNLTWLNRCFGGFRVAADFTARHLAAIPGRTLTLLDVATGGADIPVGLVRRARAAGRRLRVIALDLHPQTLAFARQASAPFPEVTLVRGDARALPLRDRSVDFALCNLSLHHLDDGGALQTLKEMARVSRVALLVNDLRRSRLGLVLTTLLLRWCPNPLTRVDGPLSIRRAFTLEEVRALAARAGLAGARARRRAWFRFALEARTGPQERS